MTLEDRIILFSKLGEFLNAEGSKDDLKHWAAQCKGENGWFTEDNVLLALKNIGQQFLKKEDLIAFSKTIKENPNPKKIGVVAAGNIPLVGFHDLLCILLTGNIAMVKLSSSDSVLMRKIIAKLIDIEPEITSQIIIADRLNDADAFIATGSDNSSRYFEYYFGKKPNIIRKNRSSVAVLTGTESREDLRNLGYDIFQFFGLGCRNVSKFFVPKGYKFDTFFESIEYWNTIQIHHKYNNNYDYNKSIYLVNRNHHYDNGFLLVTQSENLVSPISVIFYEEYEDEKALEEKLDAHQGKIQCIVGKNFTPFGGSQSPVLDEFADNVNTLDFLNNL
ncbi:acyl-CoA reductase [Arcticibacterium luteifluviistationis]|uniref:Acyl-CoA reductase n=1 Tax=Arcticibacterium luteifluviistationis TaxID=1784714 RepID=A0A2Z4G7D0_9BACT|nr:acyl-CoA reductase [Arcticibacterium luteifluviistationis]AWV97015.1 acyl-CoA reductase [Arcticibacterium luteifluviistationis]